MLFAYSRDNATPYFNPLGILQFENANRAGLSLRIKFLMAQQTFKQYSILYPYLALSDMYQQYQICFQIKFS